MDSSCVETAGRAVLEMMQHDWEPLGQGELEQRLDEAVEEILEADLFSIRVQSDPMRLRPSPSVESPTRTRLSDPTKRVVKTQQSQSSELKLSGDEEEENVAVKVITDLLQNSNSSYSRSRLAGRARLSLSHTVLLSLTLLSKRLSYRSVSTSFRLEKGNIHRIFFSFCERVNALEDQQIRWPTGQMSAENLIPFSSLLGRGEGPEKAGVPSVLGVLGHTRIPIRLPVGKQDAGRRRKKEAHPDSWLNLELVCDKRGRFIHCRISRGSDTDRGGTLRDKLKQNPDMVPSGTCLVARVGCPLSTHILTPYAEACRPKENLYNKSLCTHLSLLEQAVADLKGRFQRLSYLDMGNYERARAVVLTACILHNVFLGTGDVVVGQVGSEACAQEDEGEEDEEGVRKRDEVADLLYKELDCGRM